MQPQVVLSMEQALTMPYATLRCIHQGWRVIKVEAAPRPGQKTPGDPNRYIGRPVAGKDRHSYFVAPNLGKEAIAIDLKKTAGQELLKQLVKELNVFPLYLLIPPFPPNHRLPSSSSRIAQILLETRPSILV